MYRVQDEEFIELIERLMTIGTTSHLPSNEVQEVQAQTVLLFDQIRADLY